MNNLKNNRPLALITGASKRIGKSIAIELHNRGVDIAIHCSHSKADAESLSNQLNNTRDRSAFVIQENLAETNAPASIIKKTLSQGGRIDYLVNNASIFSPMPIDVSKEEDIKRFLKINATQPKKLIQLSSEEISKRNGAVVNLIDIYALRGLKNHSVYVTSKAMLLEMSKQLAVELSPNIRINSVSPGAILWPENETELQKNQRIEILEKTAIKRIGQASDISKTVAFLLLDALYITGANINVDGGRDLYI